MSIVPAFRRQALFVSVIAVGLAAAGPTLSAPPPKPACSTSGPVLMTMIAPSQYSYTLGQSGSQGFAAEKPAFAEPSHCIGEREASRPLRSSVPCGAVTSGMPISSPM